MKKRKGFFDDIDESKNIKKIDMEESKNLCGANKNGIDDEKNVSSEKNVSTGAMDKFDEENTLFQSENSQNDTAKNGKKCGCKKRNIAVFSVLVFTLCAFVFVSVAYSLGLFNGKYSDSKNGDGGTHEEEFYFYPADYETDIFTIPEYLELDRRIKYSPDSSQSYILNNGDYAAEGEPALVILGEYLNAVIAGDYEKVNSLYTERYLEENGRHEKFPPQKLFMIRIKNERVIEEKDGYTVYYFTVSYRIFRNDGLFRNNVDEERERAQIFEIFVYGDDSGRINMIKERPGYRLDI